MRVRKKTGGERHRVRMGEKKKIKEENYKLMKRQTERRRMGRDQAVGGCRERQISRKTERRPEGLQVVN